MEIIYFHVLPFFQDNITEKQLLFLLVYYFASALMAEAIDFWNIYFVFLLIDRTF